MGSKEDFERVHAQIIRDLHGIYHDFTFKSGLPLELQLPKPHEATPDKQAMNAPFAAIDLVLRETLAAGGVFLGDDAGDIVALKTFAPERLLPGHKKACVIIGYNTCETKWGPLDDSSKALLLSHEYGHAYGWYLGFGKIGPDGPPRGYQNECWARCLELAFAGAVKEGQFENLDFEALKVFMKKYRKSLYRTTKAEQFLYGELTGDKDFTKGIPSYKKMTCPKGDPLCGRPAHVEMFHVSCNTS